MTTQSKLTPTQTSILKAASTRPGGNIEPMPPALRGGVRAKVIGALTARGFVAASDGGHFLTDAGYAAVGKHRTIPKGVRNMDTPAAVAEPITNDVLQKLEVMPRTVRPGTKLAILIDCLRQPGGIWEHRRRGHRPISGSIRYEVLKRAAFRCELCGITAEEKNIEVDHIHPKSLGGKDDLSNYQALCYSCNAAKRNTDDTDFRGLKTSYNRREPDCLFCDIQTVDRERIVAENALVYVILDGFPVTAGHSLVIPKRHTADYFDLTQAEINAVTQLLISQKNRLQTGDPTIDGFNIGMNCGESAGQSVLHCHIHLIPRRTRDVERPRGGVRHVIPGKGFY